MIGRQDLEPVTASEPPLPGEGKMYTSIFGMKILQVSGPSQGKRITHSFATFDVWNADETKLILFRDYFAWVYSFADVDGVMSAVPLFSLVSIPGSPQRLNAASARWDRRDQNLLYVLSASKLAPVQTLHEYNVAAKTCRVLRDFAAEIPGCTIEEISTCDSGQVFAMRVSGPLAGVYVWDRRKNRVVYYGGALMVSVAHGVSLSACGMYVQITCSYPNDDTIVWRWCDDNEHFLDHADRTLTGLAEHVYMGRSVMVSGRQGDNAVVFRRYEEIGRTTKIFTCPAMSSWATAHHVSCSADEQTVLISTYMGDGLPCANEIIWAAIDGSWFLRLADARCRGDRAYFSTVDGYYDQPKAHLSRSGKYCIWSGRLGQTDRYDVLIGRMPPRPEVQRLQGQVEEAEEEVAQVERVLEQTAADRDALAADLAQAELEIKTLRSAIDADDDELSRHRAEIARLRGIAAVAKAKLEEAA